MIQRGFRTLVLWVFWTAAALSIYFGIYSDTDAWSFIQNDPSRITWAILGLFFIGTLTSFALTITLTLESIKIDELQRIAEKEGWLGIQRADKKRSVSRFFEAMRTIIEKNGELNIESLVDVEFSSYRRTAHALEIIGNLLITLGLIGTVVGLTLTLTGLTGSLEALGQDQVQLMNGLRSAMSGMGTAFYTTLLGSVLGGVLLRIYGHIDEHGVESLENSLIRICLIYCSADTKPSVDRDIRILNAEIKALTQNLTALQSALDSSQHGISDIVSKLVQPGGDGENDSLREHIHLRREHLKTLHAEWRLERAKRGWLRNLFGI